MKSFTLLIGFLVTSFICIAQDTTLVVSRSMMDPKYDQLRLTDKNGWKFYHGSDTSQDVNDRGWIKLKPVDISTKYADDNERVEGWFKINLRLDSSFENTPVGLRMSTWAAFDLYIDGTRINSFGSTGRYGKPYQENMPYNQAPTATGLRPGKNYTIAIHFVDYEIHFPSTKLKSQVLDINSLIRLTGPNYNTSVLKSIRETAVYDTIWITVCAVLSILFFLLSIQNPLEKNIRLMAYTCAALGCLMFSQSSSLGLINLTYRLYFLFELLSNLSFSFLLWIVPVTFASIFQRKITSFIRSILILSALVALAGNFLRIEVIILIAVCASLLVCTYYLVSSWKKLKGAQWAVVAGIILSFLLGILFMTMSLIYNGSEMPGYYFYVTGYCLSIPISLLVYMAMRFREVISEVREKAKQLVELSFEKEHQAINQQKILEEEVKRQTAEIRTTLDNLRATQSQLIQSEKMASLGELTAGIAHEIQNPLNFVNNFSEVNAELIEEMVDEVKKGNTEEAISIANDIKENEEKINHHGKRADAIVKGMLQHSRTTSSIKEPTDINKLADEYLRLAYHGLRAKDKSFNATLEIEYDESIGNINIIPQDIGRVILNLITNAFYAVAEKKKQTPSNYEPTVSVKTSQIPLPAGGGRSVRITVADNGNGIPAKVLDKIFQPFFTTKPAGQGTGLGLSLSYDIVKAHAGELKVETKEKEGTTFIIQLPFA